MTFRSTSLLFCSLLSGGTSLYLHTNVLAPVEKAGYDLVSFVSASSDYTNPVVNAELSPVVVEEPTLLPRTADIIPYIVKESKKSVYEIRSASGIGSGFMIRAGLIVTNKHVIKNSGGLVTLINLETGVKLQGKVLAVETEGNDIAYIQVDDLSLQPLRVGSSAELMEGEQVIAVGSPKGLTGTVTVGVLSAKNRNIEGRVYIQHDAAISPGNSGGPLINTKAVVVGMSTLSMNSESRNYQNINMAVPIELIKKYAPQ